MCDDNFTHRLQTNQWVKQYQQQYSWYIIV